LDEVVSEIKKEIGEDVLQVLKVNKFTVPERFALFSLGSALFYLQIREGNCMYVNEYIALQHIVHHDKLNFGIIISENIGVSSAIKGAFRVNPYNVNNIVNGLDRVVYMKEEERGSKYKKDLEHVLQNTTFSWIKNFFIDLKRTSSVSYTI
jgi:trehalose 6-phosphate synthase/phosphatase